MFQPHRLTDDQLTMLQEHVDLITRTLPWTPTTDRESPEHPWVDVWGGDGDLLLEVGDNLAYDVYGPDLAAALVALASHASAALTELRRVRRMATQLADPAFVRAWVGGVWAQILTQPDADAGADALAERVSVALLAELQQMLTGPDDGVGQFGTGSP